MALVITSPNIYPAARAYRTSTQTITNNLSTYGQYQAIWFDPWGMFSLGSQPTRMTCMVPGIYQVTGQVQWAANATGERYIGLVLNGVTYVTQASQAATDGTHNTQQIITTLMPLSVNDYVEMFLFQLSGGNLGVDGGAYYGLSLMGARLPAA